MDFPIEGRVVSDFEPVREAFTRNFSDGLEVGAGLCIVRNGEVVVDLWGGYRDLGQTLPWTADTLANVYSTTKGLAAIAFATLVEEGLCTYDTPVREHWPELSAAKDGLSIGDLLAHRGGLCGVEQRLSIEDLYDWEKMVSLLEHQRPLWSPGTASGYHAVTWGYLPGELVRRLCGCTLGERLQKLVCEPVGADFFLGLPDSELGRVSPLVGPDRAKKRNRQPIEPGDAPKRQALFPIALLNPLIRPYKDASSAAWQRAEIAASNGHGTARGIAAVYSAVINQISELLSPQVIGELTRERVGMQDDLVLGHPIRRGAGVILNTAGMFGPNEGAWGHSGAGGSTGFADPEKGISFAYVMNQMRDDEGDNTRARKLIRACYECV